MLKLFGEKKDPEAIAREAVQTRKWSKAIEFYEQKAQRDDRNFALWNLIGDLHMNNKARTHAVDAWRRAMEGYAQDGLHENVLGIARKVLRRAPEEEEVYLLLARACLELEYHADCLASLRSYIRTARRASEHDIKAMFARILDSNIHHPHLLEELKSLYADSKVEDVELAARVEKTIESRLQKAEEAAAAAAENPVAEAPANEMKRISPTAPAPAEGLIMLDHREEDSPFSAATPPASGHTTTTPPSHPLDFESDPAITSDEDNMAPTGEGKDHYDLGNVYREMQLWDAAAAEFEQARNDPALRLRSSLALAECLQQTNSLPAALEVLESEGRNGDGSPQERLSLHFQLGVIYEMLGNLQEAMDQFNLVLKQNSRHAAAEERMQSLRKRMEVESK